MTEIHTPLSRTVAGLVALIALAALAVRVWLSTVETGGDLGAALWDLGRFFTILTNTLVMLVLGAIALGADGPRAAWLAALTVAIMLVGVIYHVLLADLVDYAGLAAWADHGVHTAVPLGMAIWWLGFAPKRALRYLDLPVFIVWPLLYLTYALIRGARDGVYPYPFVDLTALTPAEVAVNVAGITLILLIAGVMVIFLGRRAAQ